MRTVKLKRAAAILASAAMILIALAMGSVKHVSAIQRRAVDMFMNGADESGVGVASDLAAMAARGEELALLLVRHTEEGNEAVKELAEAANALSGAKKDVWAQKRGAERFSQALSKAQMLGDGIFASDGDSRDAKSYRAITAQLKSHAITAAADVYNEAAIEANREAGRFPARLFGGLVKPLPQF